MHYLRREAQRATTTLHEGVDEMRHVQPTIHSIYVMVDFKKFGRKSVSKQI
jgi:hypothetical protein